MHIEYWKHELLWSIQLDDFHELLQHTFNNMINCNNNYGARKKAEETFSVPNKNIWVNRQLSQENGGTHTTFRHLNHAW